MDLHCHILPGADDGARDLGEALAMLCLARDSGVTEIAATPHFNGTRQSLPRLKELYSRFLLLQKAAREEQIDITLYPGAEILCLPQTVQLARDGALPTLGDSRCVLLEFHFDTPAEVMDALLDGIAQWDYLPVVAHPERYDTVLEDPRIVQRWFEKGYVIQLNKGSILGSFGYRVQKTAEWLLLGGLAHLVASDAHSARQRTPDMSRLRQHLEDLVTMDYLYLLLEENPARLIRGQGVLPAEEMELY